MCIFFALGARKRPDRRIFVLNNPQKSIVMPVQKTQGGYRWGQSGKVYPTKAQAEAQGRAAYASGYREKPTQSKKK